jgi:GMP reductase
MRIDNDVRLDFKDVLIRPKRSVLGSRKEVDVSRKFTFRNYLPNFPNNTAPHQYWGIPIMASNMDGVATFEMADCLAEAGLFTCLVKSYSAEELIEYFDKESLHYTALRTESVAVSIGIREHDSKKFEEVYNKVGECLKYVCIDVANGYSERFVSFVKQFRDKYPYIVIIAGNVVTGEMTEQLVLNGADIVKVGIGPGSVCTTRIQTGVGYPQLSAVIECADAAHGLGGHIIADGGCTSSGDVAKAFAGGADFVMLGGMLAGHDEGGGDIITKLYKTDKLRKVTTDHSITYEDEIEERKFVQFYGMSSEAANKKHFGGLKEYRSAEGRDVLIPYKGPVGVTIQDILGGLRSTCTYAGAMKLKNLSKCTTFVMCHDTHNRVYENN